MLRQRAQYAPFVFVLELEKFPSSEIAGQLSFFTDFDSAQSTQKCALSGVEGQYLITKSS